MNTIPSTFNARQINRAVLGGHETLTGAKLNISVVLLNSQGSHFRVQTIENLIKCGFSSIVSLEPNPDNYNIEDFAMRFPFVKFIVPLEKVTDGDMVNIGMSEVSGDYVLVLRDTLKLPSNIISPNLAYNLVARGNFCVVPRLITSEKQGLPVQIVPVAYRSKFDITESSTVMDCMKTLYPFDYIGLYNKQKFILLGGYDYTIKSAHWQNIDLAMRSWLWGEETTISTAFQLEYSSDLPCNDRTKDESYLRFYLKNILPRYKTDHGTISKKSFVLFFTRSSLGLFDTIQEFKCAQLWVKKNKFRFKQDVMSLIENWDKKNDSSDSAV